MKTKLNFLVVAFVLGIILSSCQKDAVIEQKPDQQPVTRAMGALMLPADEYAKIPLATLTLDEMLKSVPTSVFLKTPFVGDQGGEGSCVAWGTTYAARSITKFSKDNSDLWSNYSNILSPEYVYNQIKISTCESGSYIVTGLNLLRDQGACTWTSMAYTDEYCTTLPSATQKAEAANYKITYARVNITENDIKTHLAAGRAVVVAGPVNNDFAYLKGGAVLTKFTGRSLGGHCYCVVGYDDAKSAFKFQNSWDTGWGSAGFGWINYRYIKSWWREAYVMYDVN